MDLTPYFEKTYEFISDEQGWTLPNPDKMFQSQKWNLPELMSFKKYLNEVKGRLNDFPLQKWHKHTYSMNPSGVVVRKLRYELNPAFLTQAWCKFYETVSRFDLIPQYAKDAKELHTVHLCEAPGAFVASLNHFLVSKLPEIKWNWMATTLNPHYEGNDPTSVIHDDRLILTTHQHWTYGSDHTGNIMNASNMQHLLNEAKRRGLSGRGTLLLITADGSINCQTNPAEQESTVFALHLWEAVTAMLLLDPGGSLLLKTFTSFEAESVCLRYLLVCSFRSVVAWKPATSREGNSEIYLVCMKYYGKEKLQPWLDVLSAKYGKSMDSSPLFPLDSLPNGFLDQVVSCAKTFMDYQISAIEKNIVTFVRHDERMKKKKFNLFSTLDTSALRQAVADEFFERYKPEKIPIEAQLSPSNDRISKSKPLKWLDDLYDQSGELTFNKSKECSHFEMWNSLSGALKSSDVLKTYLHCNKSIFFISEGFAVCEIPHLDINLDLQDVKVGMPVEQVLCSKFCHVWFMNLHKKIQELWSLLNKPCINENVAYNDKSGICEVEGNIGCYKSKRIMKVRQKQKLEEKTTDSVVGTTSGEDTPFGSAFHGRNNDSNTKEEDGNLMAKPGGHDFEVGGDGPKVNDVLDKMKHLNFEVSREDLAIFLWSDKMCSKKLRHLVTTLSGMQVGGSLMIQGSFPLLTRFQVGIIYLLGSLFHQLFFIWPTDSEDTKQDFSILLNKHCGTSSYHSKVINFLDEIANLAQNQERQTIPQSILELVPLPLLCEENFISCLSFTNHLFLEYNGEELLKRCADKLKL